MANADDTVEAKANKALAERITRVRLAMDEALASLAAPLRVAPATVEATGERVDLRSTLRFLEAARTAGSQREILSALLDVACTCYARTLLFIARSGSLVAWEARNIEVIPGARRALQLTVPARGDHLAARAVSSGGIMIAGSEGPGLILSGALGGFVPARSAAVPLVVRGRVVAVLYGDCGTGGATGTESLFDVIGRLGGLCIEALGSRGRSRSTDVQRGITQVSPAGRAQARYSLAASAGARPDTGGAGFEDHAPGVEDLVPMTDSGVTSTAPQAPEEAEMQARLGDIDVRREPAAAPLGPEERRADADAHRLASLLISELLLYNEEAVILGRRHHDLSRRLAKEIERSRQAYAARVPAAEHGAGGYFDEELVRVLAEGDPSVLGG